MAAVRVGFDTGPLHGPMTGIGYAVRSLHDALAQRDDVEVVDYLLSFRARPGPDVRRLPLPAAIAHRLWGRLPGPRVDRWLHEVDVLHGTNYVVPPSRLPRVVSVYDAWFLRRPDAAAPAVRRAGAVLTRAVQRGAVVHTSSRATEAVVRDLLPGAAVQTVHLGPLPLPAASEHPPDGELAEHPFVLAIGTVERRKNLPVLVQAFGRVAATDPALRLVIAGGAGDDEQATHSAVDRLPAAAARRVLFTGRVDEPTRSWLLRHARVLAYPSLDEGFGFPVLDAHQAGTPVVASTAGSIPEVAGDGALLVDAADAEGLADALVLAAGDGATRERLIAAGEANWRRFSWEACAVAMTALYRRVVAGDVDELR